MDFSLVTNYQPAGDQPAAIKKLLAGLYAGQTAQTLLGVTGSGKTFTMANIVNQLQRPTLVISHNKTLAAQLASEFRAFFPNNAVHYFVSFYDYYQPESYLPRTDTYIEKTTQLNEEISRLRHAATEALLSHRDVIIVASVSCIYGLGSPAVYKSFSLDLQCGQMWPRRDLLQKFISMQFQRNELGFKRSTFRVKGESVEIFPALSEHTAYRLRFFGDELETIQAFHTITGKIIDNLNNLTIFPATHYIAPPDDRSAILKLILADLEKEVSKLKKAGKILEAHRLQQRTAYDVEMIRETGFTNGIENYSRYFDQRVSGQPPYTLLDYFPKDFLLFIDESHVTIPQIGGMHKGDRARKQTLVDYGFRLQAALDNRPLQFSEFTQHINQVIYVSATPANYELKHSNNIVEQIIRPTGLLDPEIILHNTAGQIEHLHEAIKQRVKNNERVLVTTLTKRLAEELTDYLQELGIAVNYLHSEIDTLERLEILRDLRLGKYDVVVGINLLREGLDLPEVSLVAILDADKQGFLRNDTALIQTIGRAARHLHGQVIMYADTVTAAMKTAINETKRRRKIQQNYNLKHHITPLSTHRTLNQDRLAGMPIAQTEPIVDLPDPDALSKPQRTQIIKELNQQMLLASQNLQFEQAAALRDEIKRWQS